MHPPPPHYLPPPILFLPTITLALALALALNPPTFLPYGVYQAAGRDVDGATIPGGHAAVDPETALALWRQREMRLLLSISNCFILLDDYVSPGERWGWCLWFISAVAFWVLMPTLRRSPSPLPLGLIVIVMFLATSQACSGIVAVQFADLYHALLPLLLPTLRWP